jgi:hypothetical protein
MRTGKIRAPGIELQNGTDWRFILGIIGIFQIFGYLGLGGLGVITPNFTGFEVSIIIFIASFPILGYLRLSHKAGEYLVEWNDARGALGAVEVSYTTPKGKRRDGLIVKNVKARPTEPLFMGGYSRNRPVVELPGTEASLIISFKNDRRISLGLGFSRVEAMNEVYEQLNSHLSQGKARPNRGSSDSLDSLSAYHQAGLSDICRSSCGQRIRIPRGAV